MTNTEKGWIDRANYEDLLRRWRHSDQDPIFQGKDGEYYAMRMEQTKRRLGSNAEAVAISKKVGW